MPWFRCLVRGENFLLTLSSGRPEYRGFYTTRWVNAEDKAAAEAACVQLIKSDPYLAQERRSRTIPMLYVEEIELLDSEPAKQPGKGYTFYDMDQTE